MKHLDRLFPRVRPMAAVCAVVFAVHLAETDGKQPGRREPRPRLDLTVYEGVGIQGLRIGDPADQIERILGEADAGSEHFRKYRQIGLDIQLHEGKVYSFSFNNRFPGKLSISEIEI